jgi:hypothetical protein
MDGFCQFITGEPAADGGADASVAADAGSRDDASVVDAGEPADSGSADAGVSLDAGSRDDASVVDAGVGSDAGDGSDAGFDAGAADSGVGDAGYDAGFDAGYDAGFDAGFDAGYDAGFDAGFVQPWALDDWQRRASVTFDHAALVQAAEEIPVRVRLPASITSQAVREQLRFVDDTGALLPHEVELMNATVSEVWVRFPRLTGTHTTIWVYWMHAGDIGGIEDSKKVFSAYESVWHLGGDTLDSAFRGTDGQAQDGLAFDDGQVGAGGVFDGAAWINLGTNLEHLRDVTYARGCAWSLQSALETGDVLAFAVGSAGSPDSSRFSLERSDVGAVEVVARGADTAGARRAVGDDPALNRWQWACGVINWETDIIRVFQDGVSTKTNSGAGLVVVRSPDTASQSAAIGAEDHGGYDHFVGSLDEVRISTRPRSDSWMFLEHLAMLPSSVTVDEPEDQ